jgi:putative ABC transport system permease protein
MSLLENIFIAFESLWQNRVRSFLALLGIVIGVFAVTAMVSVGQMASAGITKSIESVASRSIIVQPDYRMGMNVKRLKQDDLDALGRLPVTVNPQLQISAQYERKQGERHGIQIVATQGDIQQIDPSVRMSKGRYFTKAEAEGAAAVCVLNPTAVEELLRGQEPVGKRVRLFYPGGQRIELTVIGELEGIPAMFGGNMPMAYCPVQTMWRSHPDTRRGEYDYAVLRVPGKYDMNVLAAQAKQIMVNRYGADVWMVESIESLQNMLGTVMTFLEVFLAIVSALSLLVGGIGIMNIMLVSVTERTREIGLRKALGATSGQIRTQFLFEAMALTLVGGIIGIVLALLLLWSITLIITTLDFSVSPWTIVISVTVSTSIGLIFGVWPASRAASLDPIESLRYE